MLEDWLFFSSPFLSFLFLSGSQERQDKLKEIGFVDILHKLTQAADPNLSERWVKITNKFQF